MSSVISISVSQAYKHVTVKAIAEESQDVGEEVADVAQVWEEGDKEGTQEGDQQVRVSMAELFHRVEGQVADHPDTFQEGPIERYQVCAIVTGG